MTNDAPTFEIDVKHYQLAESALSGACMGVSICLGISRLAALTILLQPVVKMLRLDTADTTRQRAAAHFRALADVLDVAPGLDDDGVFLPVVDRMMKTGNAILDAQERFNSEYISDGETKQ